MMKRREFLSSLPLTAAACRPLLADAAGEPGRDEWAGEGVLVLLEMVGGCDGLSMVVPFRDDAYYRLRPRIAQGRGQVLPIDDSLAFPAAVFGLHDLFIRGHVAVRLGVGPGPSRPSHFVARAEWSGLLRGFGLRDPDAALCGEPGEFVERAVRTAREVASGAKRFSRLGLAGFDTHVEQGGGEGPLAARFRAISDAVSRMAGALIRENRFGESLILVCTEFGRSPSENRWGGTDHGRDAPWLLIGGRVRPGVYGRVPDLDEMADAGPAAPALCSPGEVLAGLFGGADLIERRG